MPLPAWVPGGERVGSHPSPPCQMGGVPGPVLTSIPCPPKCPSKKAMTGMTHMTGMEDLRRVRSRRMWARALLTGQEMRDEPDNPSYASYVSSSSEWAVAEALSTRMPVSPAVALEARSESESEGVNGQIPGVEDCGRRTFFLGSRRAPNLVINDATCTPPTGYLLKMGSNPNSCSYRLQEFGRMVQNMTFGAYFLPSFVRSISRK